MVLCASQLYFTNSGEGKPADGVWYTWDWHRVVEVLGGNAKADTVRFARLETYRDGEPRRSATLQKCANILA